MPSLSQEKKLWCAFNSVGLSIRLPHPVRSLFLFCLLLIQLAIGRVYGQGLVTVDQFKGRAQVSIPIGVVKRGAISVPVSLDYSAAGIQVSDKGEEFGIGWSLNAGGKITRDLRDLPDEQTNGGWLYGSNAAQVESFAIANDNSTATCTDESTDVNYLNTNFPTGKDSEPDVFHVSAPDLSCDVVFDKNHVARIIPYRDYVVNYTITSGMISAFTITKDDGTVYTFSSPDLASKVIPRELNKPVPTYFVRAFQNYSVEITYNANWYLTQIVDSRGNAITMNYVAKNEGDTYTVTPAEFTERQANGTFVKKSIYKVSENTPLKRISNIQGDQQIRFEWSYPTGLSRVYLPGNRVLWVDYESVPVVKNLAIYRYYLKSLYEEGCDALPPYQFYYNHVDLEKRESVLPPFDKGKQDAWGYYNASADTVLTPQIYIYPSAPGIDRYRIYPIPNYTGTVFTIPGADRRANPAVVMAGSLEKIVYPTGGSTTIEYESNTFYDPQAHTDFSGGGIRVKKITHSDGLDAARNIVTEYSYTDPATGHTTGKLLSMPSLAFTRVYTGGAAGTQAFWEFSTLRSDEDLSVEPTDVVYGQVTVRQTGSGKAVYEYTLPGTYGDASTGDWTPTVAYVGRANCVDIGGLGNSTNTYPYAPNPNYDFRRGLLKAVTNYREGGSKISRTEYAYQSSNAAVVVKGLKLDDLDGTKTYARYSILTGTDELVTSKKEIQYDLGDATKSTEVLTSFTYGSAAHKQLTKSAMTNSDGGVQQTYFRYVKDYGNASAGDTLAMALAGLKAQNANLLVERYTSLTRSGETEKITSGKLTTFQPISVDSKTRYVPREDFQFTKGEGITGFQPSQVTSNTLQKDARYVSAIRYESYDARGRATVLSDRNKNIQTYYYAPINYSTLPSLLIQGARFNELIYSGFETNEQGNLFTKTGSYQTESNARSGNAAIRSSGSSSYLQGSVKKGRTQRYVFSAWLMPTAAGNLVCTLTASNGTVKTYSMAYTAGTDWKYQEMSVPVTDMTANFTVKVQGGANLGLDDVLFYPDNAELTSYTYDGEGNKLSETASNGQAMYYEYDHLGRLKYVLDQDHNILRKESYVAFNTTPSLSSPSFSYDQSKALDGVAIPFSLWSGNDCLIGVTFDWDFGDGSTLVNQINPTHTYANPGSYTVKVTAKYPGYSPVTYSRGISITLRPLSVNINATGVIEVDNCHVEPPVVWTVEGYPTAQNRTYFNLVSVSGCDASATYTYQWEQSTNNGSSWTTVSAGTSYAPPAMNLAHEFNSYWMRLKVTSSCGRSGTSGVVPFIGYNSDPNCPQR